MSTPNSPLLRSRGPRASASNASDVSSSNCHRCEQLDAELTRTKAQATRVRDMLRDKLSELEQRVLDAESRAQLAEDKVRMMEQRLAAADWTDDSTGERQQVISKLETEVEEQRQLRLQDAKAVEAKAARIKEWVTNKLRELEQQNQLLREQNIKCNQQLELLRNHLKTQGLRGINFRNSLSLDVEDSPVPPPRPKSTFLANRRRSASTETSPIPPNQIEPYVKVEPTKHRRHQSITGVPSATAQPQVPQNKMERETDVLGEDLAAAVENLVLVPNIPAQVDVDLTHDYAEIYTPSREKTPWLTSQCSASHCATSRCGNCDGSLSSNSGSMNELPPTPPLHRFPSWEAKIYQVANDGLQLVCQDQSHQNHDHLDSQTAISITANKVSASGYCDINVPVYATVKGRASQIRSVPFTGDSTDDSSDDDHPSLIHDCSHGRVIDCPNTREESCSSGRGMGETKIMNEYLHTRPFADMVATNDSCNIKTIGETKANDCSYTKTVNECCSHSKMLNETKGTNEHLRPVGECCNIRTVNDCCPHPRSIDSNIRAAKDCSHIKTIDSNARNINESNASNVRATNDCSHSRTVESNVRTIIDANTNRVIGESCSHINTRGATDHCLHSRITANDCCSTHRLDSPHLNSPHRLDASVKTDSCNTRATNSSTDTSLSGSSPSKSLSPAKRSSSGSPSKSKTRDTSFESGMSDDYAIPPDALSCDTSFESSMPSLLRVSSYLDSPKRIESLEKSGHLAKLGGKLKTWRKRYFILKSGVLSYYKSAHDTRKPQGQILLDDICRITRAEGAATFEIATGKKTYYLTAESIGAVDDWIRVLQNVQRRNATKLLLSREDNKPSVQGYLTKVKNGHAKKCWCVLIGKMFLYFKAPTDTNPLGQINMRDARVEEVDHVSDSDSEDTSSDSALTIGIFPSHQHPTYLLFTNKQERDSWLYWLTVVSGGGQRVGTQYEQLVQKLMELDGDPNCVLWRHPTLLHSKENIVTPLTSLSSEALQAEAIKLFKCCQLFMSVAVDQAGIDYHVVLAQNALQQCLDVPELQSELICALVKQTKRHTQQRMGVQHLLLCATQSLFACDSVHSPGSASGPQKSSPPAPPTAPLLDCKVNPPAFAFVQGWQLLALAVSLFVPKDNRLLWYLKLHLNRNADSKSECGKYAAYCERALERTLQNGNREVKPSRMEVLSILLKNPYHHSLPHAIPVHFLNGTYQVVGFDGSTTIEEFLMTLNQEIGMRESSINGFTLFSDDPIEKELQHFVDHNAKLCDVISKWETALREKGSGKFENSRVIQLTYKNRLYFKRSAKMETDRERLLLCYQVNQQVIHGRFPINKDLSLELAALMSQIDFGEYSDKRSEDKCKGSALMALDKFYPYRYRDGLTADGLKDLQEKLLEKWTSLKGRSVADCVRIYLTCTRKWPLFGAALFQAKLKQSEQPSSSMIWLAVAEDSVTILELATMTILQKYPYTCVVTFGGCQDDFMLVVCPDEKETSEKLIFSLSKPKILEVTLLIADYMNALGQLPGTPQMNTLTRNGSHRSVKVKGHLSNHNTQGHCSGHNTLNTQGYSSLSHNQGSLGHNSTLAHHQPDILKSTPDHR